MVDLQALIDGCDSFKCLVGSCVIHDLVGDVIIAANARYISVARGSANVECLHLVVSSCNKL